MSKEAYADADIVFLPYNYLVDHAARQAQGIKVDNSIIIFDEAHNLASLLKSEMNLYFTYRNPPVVTLHHLI